MTQVEELDADERRDQAADAVDQEVAAQQDGRPRPAGSATPRSASGISATITSALNTTAERIADSGLDRPHHVEHVELREGHHEHRRQDREVLRDVVGDRERRERAAGDEQLLADLDDVDAASSGRSRGRPCCRPPWPPIVPVFIATPTSAWASAGASLVPSPHIATSRPPSCSCRIRAILSSGVASARSSSTPASSAIARAVSGVVAGDHDRPDAHGAHLVEPLADAVLDDVLEVDDARAARAGSSPTCSATTSGVPPDVPTRSTIASSSSRGAAAGAVRPTSDRGRRPLADPVPAVGQVDAAHPGGRR